MPPHYSSDNLIELRNVTLLTYGYHRGWQLGRALVKWATEDEPMINSLGVFFEDVERLFCTDEAEVEVFDMGPQIRRKQHSILCDGGGTVLVPVVEDEGFQCIGIVEFILKRARNALAGDEPILLWQRVVAAMAIEKHFGDLAVIAQCPSTYHQFYTTLGNSSQQDGTGKTYELLVKTMKSCCHMPAR